MMREFTETDPRCLGTVTNGQLTGFVTDIYVQGTRHALDYVPHDAAPSSVTAYIPQRGWRTLSLGPDSPWTATFKPKARVQKFRSIAELFPPRTL